MNNFDVAATEWDSHPLRVELARKIGDAIRRTGHLSHETRLLDYGCGTGLLGLYLLPHIKHVTGIDTSPGMLEVLQEKIVQSHLSNMEVHLLDLQNPTVSVPSSEEFDAITMNMVLHHVKETCSLLQNLKSLLRPNGTLFIADLDSEPGTFHAKGFEGVFHHGFDREELSEQLTKAGFKPLEIVTAHTMEKKHDDDTSGCYDIFLAVAKA